ncbi:protein windpipe isoform X2 [Linepithema humile]|nr:PREDICTED: uncharacterized protein LOC105667683 isoform X2 [Linepithema humile]XP_012215062.1 PREDICTED: uncharacterized protein LOC105667683 isoform X2 [Linepithema humile]XP_012215063.1 PREDICTED: uncharacterized protein LOC105667683 isoform X2 [Linepithema humile]
MQAAPYLLSLLLILLQQSGWTRGLCDLENGTEARCDDLRDLENIEARHLEILQVPVMQDVLTPGLFDNLTNLEHLDLSAGHLKKIKSGSFRFLNKLKSLNLGENRIEYLELASLEGLTHLRSLNLRRNAIRQLPPALMRLKSLKHLDVYGNPIECNCATLKVRDLVVQRGASLSKKIVCAGPGNMKGTSLMKPSATIVCSLEQQDREMQNDQAEGSGTDFEDEATEEEDNSVEYEEINSSTGKSAEPEVETPVPTTSLDSTTGSPTKEWESIAPAESTVGITTSASQRADDDEEIFFDNEDKKEQFTTEMSHTKEIKNSLFYPTYGSGDEDEGSGEGSGAGVSEHYDEERTEKNNGSTNDDTSITKALWEILFGSTETTTAAEAKDPDLEEEQFISASSTEESNKAHSIESEQVTTDATTAFVPIVKSVEVLKAAGGDDKAGNVKAEVNSLNDEQADVSPAKQPKKGMGSYVVLAILLAVVATLIGIAAYRGDICRKKRKRGDVENGTELKDMQKSLLPDAGGVAQPKITSNGNAESVPLVEGAPENDNAKIDKIESENLQTQETPRSHNGAGDHHDPVKPPRKLIASQDDERDEERPRVDVNSLRDNFFADRTSPAQPSESSITTNSEPMKHEPNGPPLSPGAQRVKITLQENPDSVPKTPILITRTMAGENLVKTP